MSTLKPKRGIRTVAISLFAIAFGLLTFKEGGAILFGDGAARVAAGNYVPFVLWFNFTAGFAYVAAGAGLWLQQRWAAWLAIFITAATAFAFAAFGVFVASGGAYEPRTAIAMTLRTLIWAAIAAAAWRLVPGVAAHQGETMSAIEPTVWHHSTQVMPLHDD